MWENHPGAALGGTAVSKPLDAVAVGDHPLFGPNVHAYSDVNDDGVAQSGEWVVPGEYAFNPVIGGAACTAAKPCSWDGVNSSSALANRNQSTVQAFYFANRFHDHLKAPPINFTDRSFEDGDRLKLETFDGANQNLASHVNNANMYTPPDGTSPVMQMYLWRGPNYREMNGGDDASILYHEYTHGLSNRLIRDAGGAGALNSIQAGAMGEGWSDWYAKDFLVSEGYEARRPGDGRPDPHGRLHGRARQPDPLPGARLPGRRDQRLPGQGHGGRGRLHLRRLREHRHEPEVHYDGEIWAETLWDLRTAVGSDAAERLITSGMRLSPIEPSFLDMRNAILLADEATGAGLKATLWAIFAARGMGYYATTNGAADPDPVEDFSLPPGQATPRGTITGRVTDVAGGAPLAGATVALGSLAALTGADGRYTLADVPAGGYPRLAISAKGYGPQNAPVSVVANTTKTVDASLPRNWAAQPGGASVTGGNDYEDQGCGSLAAIDQVPASTWSGRARRVTRRWSSPCRRRWTSSASSSIRARAAATTPRGGRTRADRDRDERRRRLHRGRDAAVHQRGPPSDERGRADGGRVRCAPGAGDGPDEPGRGVLHGPE